MSARNDGGPAFPQQRRVQRAGYNTNEFEPVGGMFLRDYFAAKAMAALVTTNTWDIEAAGNEPAEAHHVAAEAYALADAMLKARLA